MVSYKPTIITRYLSFFNIFCFSSGEGKSESDQLDSLRAKLEAAEEQLRKEQLTGQQLLKDEAAKREEAEAAR